MEDKRLAEGLDAIVRRYYAEYTDAEDMDGEFYLSLSDVFGLCFPSGELPDGREFDDLVKKPA